jgi:hypothetical protein
MADRVYSLVKGPAGWVQFLDGARVGGIYGTKEAAFEAVMVAASFVVGVGDGIQINVPSDDRTHGTDKVDRVFQMTGPSRPSERDLVATK